jgi:hypothetical protein
MRGLFLLVIISAMLSCSNNEGNALMILENENDSLRKEVDKYSNIEWSVQLVDRGNSIGVGEKYVGGICLIGVDTANLPFAILTENTLTNDSVACCGLTSDTLFSSKEYEGKFMFYEFISDKPTIHNWGAHVTSNFAGVKREHYLTSTINVK